MKTIKIADKKITIAAVALIAAAFLALASQLNSNIQAQIAVPAASGQLTDLNQLNEQIEQIKNQIKVYEQYLEAAEKNNNQILADLYKSGINDLKNRLEQLLTEQKDAEETFLSLPISDPARLEQYLKSWKEQRVILKACLGGTVDEGIKELEKMLAEGRRPAADGNLAVISSDPVLAQQMLIKAKQYLSDISREWSGKLPPGWIEVLVYVRSPGEDDQGITWCDLKPGESLPRQSMWCEGPENVLNATLKHEMTHAFLNSRFPGGVPAWLGEGIASRYDDEGRKRQQQKYLKEANEIGKLWDLFSTESIPSSRVRQYVLSELLVDYLIESGKRQGWDGKRHLFDFTAVVAGLNINKEADRKLFEERLQKFYGYRVAELERNLMAYWGINYKDGPQMPARQYSTWKEQDGYRVQVGNETYRYDSQGWPIK